VCVCLCDVETALVAKSSIVLDVKPWDDETDMAKIEECVRSIVADGLLWGACKYNIVLLSSSSSIPLQIIVRRLGYLPI